MARNPRVDAAEMMVDIEEPLPEEEVMVEEEFVEEVAPPAGLLTTEDVAALTALSEERGMSPDDAVLVGEIVEEFLGGGGEVEVEEIEVEEELPPLDFEAEAVVEEVV